MPADNDRERDLHTLLNLIDEAQALVDSSGLPDDRSKRLREVLSSAVSLATDLIETSPAAQLGAKGGAKTAERGPEYFRKIAGMRKKRAGGRPRKSQTNPPPATD
jgi:hypothetical protein